MFWQGNQTAKIVLRKWQKPCDTGMQNLAGGNHETICHRFSPDFLRYRV